MVLHKIMVPPNMSGTITDIKSGSFTVEETVATLRTDKGGRAPDHGAEVAGPDRAAYKHKYPPWGGPCAPARGGH